MSVGKSWTLVCQSEPASWTGSSTAGPFCQSEMFLGNGSTGTKETQTSWVGSFWTEDLKRSLDNFSLLKVCIYSFSPSGALRAPWSQVTSCDGPSSPTSHGFLHEQQNVQHILINQNNCQSFFLHVHLHFSLCELHFNWNDLLGTIVYKTLSAKNIVIQNHLFTFWQKYATTST